MNVKPPAVRLISKPKVNQNTSELCAHYLRTHGRAHINDIIQDIKKRGWQSSGGDYRDYRTIHQALNSNPIFRKVGRRTGQFELVESAFAQKEK